MNDGLIPLDLNKKPSPRHHHDGTCAAQNKAVDDFREAIRPKVLLLLSMDVHSHAIFALEGRHPDVVHTLAEVIRNHPYVGDLLDRALDVASGNV